MRVGIMADSHDNMHALKKAVDYFNRSKVMHVLHAGDLVAPFTARELSRLECPLTIVFGNNDGDRLLLKKVFKETIHRAPHQLQLAGKEILLLHEPDNLEALQASGHFDAIIYGHTHQVAVDREATLAINPGECGGWLTNKCTVAIWEVESNEVEIVEL
ncbi:YfcE family phosphodiesterase [candidate division KSB1 bacterium]|nr:MAG: YfcE family phosphodiesterase [candidate division KSB1 bacterium]RKY77363.1 MAG: YfcE family phosphodiesterase [candidate division KSB1 bacterium]RKY81017.1 MAG: YfcE family phosphodiesterase [candidate division KSB1 bacterium]RKY87454.1 MAG: YfcE family phosphodiesterase [candidate division KSB1 bacterium]HDI51509.1 metallophosphoesterase [Bacteroidota bacterium]